MQIKSSTPQVREKPRSLLNHNHAYNHHILATLVQVYLCSPVSLAPVQRLYSIAGKMFFNPTDNVQKAKPLKNYCLSGVIYCST